MKRQPSRASAGGAAIALWITDPGAAPAAARERWLAAWLDDGERARARDARSPSRQVEIVVGRALVRSALAAAAGGGVDPASLRFTIDPGGRPALAPRGWPAAAEELDFSVAHTRGLVVCAVARGGRVGVDAEHLARRTEPVAIARRFFSAADAAAVEAAAPGARGARFLERWMLREAYTKVLGVPLLELARERVAFEIGPTGEVGLAGAASPPAGERWRFWLLRPTPEHGLALAWRGAADASAPCVTLHRWPPPSSPPSPPITR